MLVWTLNQGPSRLAATPSCRHEADVCYKTQPYTLFWPTNHKKPENSLAYNRHQQHTGYPATVQGTGQCPVFTAHNKQDLPPVCALISKGTTSSATDALTLHWFLKTSSLELSLLLFFPLLHARH